MTQPSQGFDSAVEAAEYEFNQSVYKSTRESRAEFYARHSVTLYGSYVSIRVLIIHAGSGDTPLQCSMEVVKLQPGHRPYEALSYVWGPKPQLKYLWLDNMQWEITDNLDAALRALRRSTADRVLWVDQLCINQNVEISTFRWMYAIYQKASQVNIWLGPATEESHRAMTYFSAPEKRLATDKELISSYSPSISEASNNPWRDLGLGLFVSEWWRRVWVVQEVILAENAMVYCGDDTLPFQELIRLTSIATSNGLEIFPQRNRTETSNAGDEQEHRASIAAVQSFYTRIRNGEAIDYVEWIAAFHTQASTLPHDRLYGLFGLADRDKYHHMDSEYKLLNFKEIYTRTTEVILRAEGNAGKLDFICLGRGDGRLPELPSWVPDFRLRPAHGQSYFPLNYLKSHPFQASPVFPMGYQAEVIYALGDRNEKLRELSVWGRVVDVVTKISQVNDIDEAIASEMYYTLDENPFVKEAIHMSAGVGMGRPSKTSNGRALSRTLVCDMDYSGRRLQPGMGFFELPGISISRGCSRKRSHIPNDHQLMSRMKFCKLLREKHHWTNGRRFMTTSNGHIGICPKDTIVGDSICVLHGASVPYVLRLVGQPKKDWKLRRDFHFCDFIGESYMHGFMDGEAFEQADRIDECFVLRDSERIK